MDRDPIPYATPGRRGNPSPAADAVGWRAAAGAAWLVTALVAAGAAVRLLCDEQQSLAVAFDVSAASPVTRAAVFIAMTTAPCVGAVLVGVASATLLYDWPVRRLAWVAALPGIAGIWSAIEIFDPQIYTGGETLATLVGAVTVQAAIIFAGTRLGRPLARWLAGHLVPPPLRAAVVALWI